MKIFITIILLLSTSAYAEVYDSNEFGVKVTVNNEWKIVKGKTAEKEVSKDIDQKRLDAISSKYKSKPSMTIFTSYPKIKDLKFHPSVIFKHVNKDKPTTKGKARKVLALYKQYYKNLIIYEAGKSETLSDRKALLIDVEYDAKDGFRERAKIWLVDMKYYYAGYAEVYLYKDKSHLKSSKVKKELEAMKNIRRKLII